MQTSTMKAAFKLPSAAFLMQIYEIFLFSASFWAFSLRFQRKNVNLQKNVCVLRQNRIRYWLYLIDFCRNF